MRNPHPTQVKILEYMKANHGLTVGKSLREIGETIGVGRKPQIVSHHIKQLEKRGLLREDGKGTYVVLDTPVSSVAYINLYSCTAECGPNGFLGDDTIIDRVPLPTKTFGITNPNDFFLIKARGDSMEPMIKEGDLVLAKVQEQMPENGTVSVVVHRDMPKIKLISREDIGGKTMYCLESINSDKHPRVFVEDEDENLRIVGVVKSIIKNVALTHKII